MGMIFAQHFADDARRLFIGQVGAQAHIVHGIQNTTVHRLEPVAGVRQGPGDDDAHGVIEVGLLHFLVDINFVDEPDFHL